MLKKGGIGGSNVNCSISYNSASFCASLTPLSPLEYSTSYTVLVKGGASSDIRDAAATVLPLTRAGRLRHLPIRPRPQLSTELPITAPLIFPAMQCPLK